MGGPPRRQRRGLGRPSPRRGRSRLRAPPGPPGPGPGHLEPDPPPRAARRGGSPPALPLGGHAAGRAVHAHPPRQPPAAPTPGSAAPAGGTPRSRDAPSRPPHASREAGPRRPHGRWRPTPGEPRAPPTCLTGSAASAGHQEARGPWEADRKRGEGPLTSAVIAPLRLSRCRKRARGTSGRCTTSSFVRNGAGRVSPTLHWTAWRSA
jgi:hypothetical protein